MITKKFLNWIDESSKKVDKLYESNPNFATKEQKIFAQAIKMQEEVGELSAEILEYFNLQRDKGEKKEDALASEFADVIITVMVLSHSMDIDMNKAISSKVQKLNKRFENL